MDENGKRKVLVVLPDGRGGAERQSIRIAGYLPRERFIIVYAIIGATDSRVSGILPDGADIRRIRLSHIWQAGSFRLFRLFRKEKPFAVLSSFHYLNGRCILAARLAGVPKVIIRGNITVKDGDPVGRLLNRLFYRKASAIICQTEELRDEMISRMHVKAEIAHALYNPIDTRMLSEAAAKGENPYGPGIHLVCPARICPDKGQDVLLRSFLLFIRNHSDAHLHLLGDVHDADGFYESLKDFVSKNSLEAGVHFEGFQSNPWPWIKNADCLVLASYVEGLPNVLIEAQFLGVPCVATRSVRSISRIIDDGVNGYVVPMGDADAIAAAIEKAVTLKNVPFTYKSASPDDFVDLFETC